MFGTELELLRNLPKALLNLTLNPPHKSLNDAEEATDDLTANQFVSALSTLLLQKEQHEIMSIQLSGVNLPSELHKYLLFFFGYGGKIQMCEKDQYCLLFND